MLFRPALSGLPVAGRCLEAAVAAVAAAAGGVAEVAGVAPSRADLPGAAAAAAGRRAAAGRWLTAAIEVAAVAAGQLNHFRRCRQEVLGLSAPG